MTIPESLRKAQWWNAKEGERHEVAFTQFYQLINNDAAERRANLSAMRSMYLDIPDERFGPMGFTRKQRSSYNLLQGSLDSAHAQITVARPRPMVQSVGGDGPLRRRSVKRQRWTDGEFARLDAYTKLADNVRNGAIYGTGLLKIETHAGRNRLVDTWCGDCWTDPREERFDCVRTLYQIYAMDRDVLAAHFPAHEEAIYDIKETHPDDQLFPDLKAPGRNDQNMVTVMEAWRLPISDKLPGRRILVVQTATLNDKPWTRPDFPFVRYRWAPKPQSWWGQGMIERGCGIQSDLNELCHIIRETYETFVTQFWVKKGTVQIKKLDDIVGKINEYDGDKPPDILSPAINPVILQQEEKHAQRVYQVLGVNEMHAGAKRPPGVESGKGLQMLNDSTTVRFVPQERAHEKQTLDLYHQLIWNSREIVKENPNAKQRVYGGAHQRGGLQPVDFLETESETPDENDEIFVVQVFPVAGLSNTISQRMDDIERLDQMGAFPDPRQKRALMNMPDIEAHTDLDLAGMDLVEASIERALDGEDTHPESYWPRDFAVQRIGQAIQLAMLEGEDPDGIQRLRNLHMALLEMPVGATGLTVPPNDPSLAPQLPVQNPLAVPPPAGPAGPAGPPPEMLQ